MKAAGTAGLAAMAVFSIVLQTNSAIAAGPSNESTSPSASLFTAESYDVRIDYASAEGKPGEGEVSGAATIKAKADTDLDTVTLSLGIPASGVEVDGRPAKFEASTDSARSSLVITPGAKITRGHSFTVKVRYKGKKNAGGSEAVPRWFSTTDGGLVFGPGQRWFPNNSTDPRQSPSLKVTATVPSGWAAVGAGELESKKDVGAKTQYTWQTKSPGAFQESSLEIGPWTINRKTVGGVPVNFVYNPADKKLASKYLAYIDKTPRYMDFLSRKFGKYPFSNLNVVFAESGEPGFEDLPFLSTPGKVQFASAEKYWDEPTFVHEVSHSWFGGGVRAAKGLKGSMVSEGMAVYASWIWREHEGEDLDKIYRGTLKGALKQSPDFWKDSRPEAKGSDFISTSYVRAPLMYVALRQFMGQTEFDAALREWREVGNGSVKDVDDLTRYLQQKSTKDLSEFFDQWLRGDKAPDSKYLFPH